MLNFTKLVGVSGLIFVLGACSTSIDTRPGYAITSLDRALPTKGYKLPMLQYELAVAYKLSQCPPTLETAPLEDLEFTVEAVAASTYVPGESFEIDYSKLSSPLKVSDFTIENYEDGTLKGISLSAEDKTGDVIKSTVEIGASVASLAMGNPLPAVGLAQSDHTPVRIAGEILKAAELKKKRIVCTDDARSNLAHAENIVGDVKRLTTSINRRAKEIEAITVRAGLKLTNDRDAERIYNIHKAMRPELEELALAEQALTKAGKTISYVEDRNWPGDPYIYHGSLGFSEPAQFWFESVLTYDDVTVYDPEVLDEKLEDREENLTPEEKSEVIQILNEFRQRQANLNIAHLCDQKEKLLSCLNRQIGVYAELISEYPRLKPCPAVPSGNQTPCHSNVGTISARDNVAHNGVFYRDTARAKLLLCGQGRSCRKGDRPHLVKTDWDVAPQLGQLRFAKFTNGPFQNNLLKLSLRKNGTVEKFQYAEKSSVVAAALGAASTGLAKVEAFDKERDAKRRQQILDRRADITYRRSEAAAERTEAAALRTDELAILQYEFDKISKEKALLDARFPSTVSKEYLNETARLEAVAAQLRAQIAIKEAEEKLKTD